MCFSPASQLSHLHSIINSAYKSTTLLLGIGYCYRQSKLLLSMSPWIQWAEQQNQQQIISQIKKFYDFFCVCCKMVTDLTGVLQNFVTMLRVSSLSSLYHSLGTRTKNLISKQGIFKLFFSRRTVFCDLLWPFVHKYVAELCPLSFQNSPVPR